jgi:GT2 family glycosyltransferase
MDLAPTSRRPIHLPDETVETILLRPVPAFEPKRIGVGRSASIVVVTYDNLLFTRLCLESVLAMTEYPDYELIVVDNASTDATVDYLRELADRHADVRIALNSENRGFAAACNQGLALATGDLLVLLNNDTVVGPSWLSGLARHLEDPQAGLVGPVTNRLANEAEIEATYQSFGEFLDFAETRTRKHWREVRDIGTLAMFCLAFRRELYERLGPLDERFGIGLFEDEDYSIRARAAGYRLVCAEDTFVHHFGEASFGRLAATGEYARLLAANRSQLEQKWGIVWQPYQHRQKPEYGGLVDRIRDVAAERLPDGATVLVVSRGDDELLRLGRCQARHFPEAEDGVYAGYHPADGAEAVAQLEAQRARGADYLILPETAFWWLEHYPQLEQHLSSRYREVVRREDTCLIFSLGGRENGSGKV